MHWDGGLSAARTSEGRKRSVATGERSGERENFEVDCSQSIERLYHYLDGELTDERRLQIQGHLDECPPCVEAFDFETELRQVIANRCRDHVPPALLDRVRAALTEEARAATDRQEPGSTVGSP